MSVRLIAGRAGTGKTHYCLSQICQALAHGAADGPRLIMLVPEQAALQMERGILGMMRAEGVAPVLGRCEVLGFRRLAHRVLNETLGPAPVALTTNGRQMALRHMVNKHREQLREFHRVAQRTGFIRMVGQAIVRLLQECVSPEQVASAATEAEVKGDVAANRLHDVAVMYRAYLEYLGNDRVDLEGVLDLARARFTQSQWLRGAQIWIDGFAGFTRQQMRMIGALAVRASQIEIAMLVDPRRGFLAGQKPDELSIFARTDHTLLQLSESLREVGVSLEAPIVLDKAPPRFTNTPNLLAIERDIFRVPLRSANESRPEAIAGSDIKLAIARNRRAEVAAAVRSIVDLVQRPENPLRYRDIAIIVRDLTPYHDLISAQLLAHDIPFFIDRRRPTHHHPLVSFVRAALAMHNRSAFGTALIAMLKTGLSELSEDDINRLENYVLAYGLFSLDSWSKVWAYPSYPGRDGASPSPHEVKVLEELNSVRARLLGLLNEWLPGKDSVGPRLASEWLAGLYGVIERFGCSATLERWHRAAGERGQLDLSAEHQQVWNDLCRLFDEMHESLGREPMNSRQFTETLEAGLSEFTLGLVPATLDQVLVSSIERSRHPPIKAAFVLGLTDQDFPSRIADDELFGDPEKKALARANVDIGRMCADRVLDERMLAYVAFTRPSEFLWVSYPQGDESGKPVIASPYWMALRSAIPRVAVETLNDDGMGSISTANELAGKLAGKLRRAVETGIENETVAYYEWARSHPSISPALKRSMAALALEKPASITAKSCEALWPDPHRTSVSALEDYAKCAFRHYVKQGLRLEPRVVHEISAMELGTLYHSVLEQFVNDMIENNKTLQQLDEKEIEKKVLGYCEKVLPTIAQSRDLDEPTRKWALWRGRRELKRAVQAYKKTIAGTGLEPFKTEMSFGRTLVDQLPALALTLKNGKKVLLRGVIDRIDLLRGEKATLAVVFDYKRSSYQRRLKLDEAFHGLALQLLAYLLVLRDCGRQLGGIELIPGGAFYLPLLGPLKKVDHPSEAIADDFHPFNDYRPRGVVDFDHIEMFEPKLSGSGRVFSVSVNKDGGPGHVNRTDVVFKTGMTRLLDHVRTKMVELAEAWLDGNILAKPYQLGDDTPCAYCDFKTICRMEYASRALRPLPPMSRTQVLEQLGVEIETKKKK